MVLFGRAQVRQLAAVLLRRRIGGHWRKLAALQVSFKASLLHQLEHEPVRRRGVQPERVQLLLQRKWGRVWLRARMRDCERGTHHLIRFSAGS